MELHAQREQAKRKSRGLASAMSEKIMALVVGWFSYSLL
ncbi:hypothetical protein ADIS_2289 [Lunatimonas lonarensis]|uniref:Uncharacterized protein n=1 Tax=Lunatimonas lonarensis TaxID=1232681 RepID=R7ZT90_9BACT|nr:hypothetical protein ADIS_2289 [Lunatimonas lonarensis]